MKRTFEVLMIISFPFLIASLLVGLIISFLQTLTNIQEATLTFVPKIIVVIVLGAILGGFIFSQMRDFITEIFMGIPNLIK